MPSLMRCVEQPGAIEESRSAEVDCSYLLEAVVSDA